MLMILDIKWRINMNECYLCEFTSEEEDFFTMASIDVPNNYQMICLGCDDKCTEAMTEAAYEENRHEYV